jgi:hypothetical protein
MERGSSTLDRDIPLWSLYHAQSLRQMYLDPNGEGR